MNILNAFREGRAKVAIERRLSEAFGVAIATALNPAGDLITLEVPRYLDKGRHDPIADRVLAAYVRMKADQPKYPAYAPAPLWAQQLATAYAPLNGQDAATFLANFGLNPAYTGIDSGHQIREANGSAWRRRQFINTVLWPQLELWRLYTGADWSTVAEPQIGQACGFRIAGHFMTINGSACDMYARELAPFIADAPRPTIAELGGGLGRFSWTFPKYLPESRYIDYDLPEVATLAAYYSLHARPDRRALLYGEGQWTDGYDLAFLPSWAVETMPLVDLVINKNSLGEMAPAAVHRYLDAMIPRTRWFWHMNHDGKPVQLGGGEVGLLARDYPVPARMVSRYLEPGHALWLRAQSDIFVYLYATSRVAMPQ
jgi:hypothetical protein